MISLVSPQKKVSFPSPRPIAAIAHDSPLRDGGTIGIALHAIKPDFRSPTTRKWGELAAPTTPKFGPHGPPGPSPNSPPRKGLE